MQAAAGRARGTLTWEKHSSLQFCGTSCLTNQHKGLQTISSLAEHTEAEGFSVNVGPVWLFNHPLQGWISSGTPTKWHDGFIGRISQLRSSKFWVTVRTRVTWGWGYLLVCYVVVEVENFSDQHIENDSNR